MQDKPEALKDINMYLLYTYKNKEDIYAIGSVTADKYIEVKENSKDVVFLAITYMNGQNTAEQIADKVEHETNTKIDVSELCTILEKAGLLEGKTGEKGEYDLLSLTLFRINIHRLESWFRSLSKFTVPVFILTAAVFFLAFIYGDAVRRIADMDILNTGGSSIGYFVSILMIMGGSLLLHEMAHGIVAYKEGLLAKEMVMSLYLYVSPIVYLKIPGIYTLRPGQRIKIWSAGIVTNTLLASISIVIYTAMESLGIQNNLLLLVFYVNIVLIISNLFPLLPLDGYFIISTVMKIPNLRKKSFVDFKKMFLNKAGRLKGIYLIYFILSSAMMAYIVVGQIVKMYVKFVSQYHISNNILESMWSIKFYLVILILFILSKVKKYNAISL